MYALPGNTRTEFGRAPSPIAAMAVLLAATVVVGGGAWMWRGGDLREALGLAPTADTQPQTEAEHDDLLLHMRRVAEHLARAHESNKLAVRRIQQTLPAVQRSGLDVTHSRLENAIGAAENAAREQVRAEEELNVVRDFLLKEQ